MRQPGGPGTSPTVLPEQVVAFRLQRHHLLRRAPREALVSVAGEMGGVHAQVPSAARLSLWARIGGITQDDVDRAVGRSRSLCKVWCMRRTLHLVPSADVATFVRGTALRAHRDVTWVLNRGYRESEVRRLVSAVLESLSEPCTTSVLADRVGVALRLQRTTRQGGGWGSRRQVPAVAYGTLTFPSGWLLHLAGAYGVVCVAPGPESSPTYVRAAQWIPRWKDVPTLRAEEELLRRYLSVAGPASPRDYAWWTGIRLGDVQRIWARVQSELVLVRVGEMQGWVRASDLPVLERASLNDAPVRLLPYFDSFVLQHEDKTHLLSRKIHHRLYRPQGWVAPAVLVNGRVAGTWTHSEKGRRGRVRVEAFAALPSHVREGVEREAESLGRFLGWDSVDTAFDRGGPIASLGH